jgi:hypothetical protein
VNPHRGAAATVQVAGGRRRDVQAGRRRCCAAAAARARGEYLDVVALGTIADVVPLVGENRVLARLGLERLNRDPRSGCAR